MTIAVVDRPATAAPHSAPSARSWRPGAYTIFRAAGVMDLAQIWRILKKDLRDPYRPELHYMRGPGPKWREKARQYAHLRVSSPWASIRSVAGDATASSGHISPNRDERA
jgi:hypothetical protein